MLSHAIRFICTCAVFLAAAATASAQQVVFDEWRYHQPGDLLYDEGVHTAGVILEDYSFAVIVLDAAGKNTAIGAVIPGTEFEDSISSTLTMTDGFQRNLTISGDRLRREQPKSDGMVSYTFSISEEDVEFFQAALTWTLQAGDQSATFPLAGSRDAVDAARAAQQISADGAEVRAEWIAACDAAAGHPYDTESDAPGVAWSDIDADTATEACLNAYAAGDVSPRTRFQLGRAYDKAGDARALELLGRAALGDEYPIAFHSLAALYTASDYTFRDLGRARDLLEQGAALGDTVSAYALGRMLVERDADKDRGRALLRDAAEAGYPAAQRIYGAWLIDGTLENGDPALARDYLERAADGGDADAAYALAQLYLGDSGLDPDPRRYLSYLKLAARRGNAQALDALALD
ncbi:tetratricopeptide repeat protein [Pseudosulfitobacter koreensis]|uniref:TPR repeat n=1 Tax=Pseudosulfitobacter koreensis TaxID=2968472 RepID=A0ABT1YW95_9RHOB|nr:hypothetical protein [Pseudosulfitobacter koreense]MCR8825164.1 hypothetical protein [Pseudosulfitobacter koreense]